MESKKLIIIQARMGSTRLPGKVMKRVFGKPLLGYLLERLSSFPLTVATTKLPEDDQIAKFAEEAGVPVYRGSVEDVLSRYAAIAKKSDANVLVRITGDCPLIDPKIVQKGITLFEQGGADFVSNTLQRSYPKGMDVEVFSKELLLQAEQQAKTAYEREHVTPYFYQNPFRIKQFTDEEDLSRFQICVDTQEDFLLVEKIIAELYPKNTQFGISEITKWLKAHDTV